MTLVQYIGFRIFLRWSIFIFAYIGNVSHPVPLFPGLWTASKNMLPRISPTVPGGINAISVPILQVWTWNFYKIKFQHGLSVANKCFLKRASNPPPLPSTNILCVTFLASLCITSLVSIELGRNRLGIYCEIHTFPPKYLQNTATECKFRSI